jgi:hypothetical protein
VGTEAVAAGPVPGAVAGAVADVVAGAAADVVAGAAADAPPAAEDAGGGVAAVVADAGDVAP